MTIDEMIEILGSMPKKKVLKNYPLRFLELFKDESIVKNRKLITMYRPYEIMQTERYFSRRIERLFYSNQIHLENIKAVEFPQKTIQLGERANIYGKLISRVETLINLGAYELTEENIIIKKHWNVFTRGMNSSEKRDFIKYRDYFLRILFFTEKEGQLFAEEKNFLMINFTYRTADGRLKNLQKNQGIEYANSIEIVEVKLNRAVYGCLHIFLKKSKRRLGKGQGVRKSIADLPFIISERIDFYKKFIIAQVNGDPEFHKVYFRNENIKRIGDEIYSMQYNDKMRIAFERIVDVYETGKENRKKDRIDYGTQIYDLLFSSKHSGDTIRFAYIIIVFNIILQDIDDLPLLLVINKEGKSEKYLIGQLELS